MLIDRTHKNWMIGIGVATVCLGLSYTLYIFFADGEPYGGSWLGLIYGNAAFLIMIFATLLGARKKAPTWRIGRAVTWMKGHLWLSLLLIPLVFFHSAFQVGGTVTLLIWIFFGFVMVSGILGAIAQHFLPRLMTEQVTMETVYDEIDHVIEQLQYEADVQITQLTGPLGFELKAPEGVTPAKIKEGPLQPGSDLLKQFYLEKVRSVKTFESREKIASPFGQAKLSLPPVFHDTIANLADLMEERRQLARQKTLHHWLHGWLFVHVPVSAVLMLLVIVHIVTALWY